ncbi:EF-hand domain-containing protein [Streptosporangium lutulentum]
MSAEPTGERLTELRRAFAAIDTDGDGFITEKEFGDHFPDLLGRRHRVAEQGRLRQRRPLLLRGVRPARLLTIGGPTRRSPCRWPCRPHASPSSGSPPRRVPEGWTIRLAW